MFALRFFAGPIVHRISPLGLLFVSGLLGFAGLQLLGSSDTVLWCIIAATVYSCGKTFLWPTMLAVASEQFPKGGAITIGAIGGMGMLSAGLLGGPGIGFKQDYNASHKLNATSPEVFERYKATNTNTFLGFSVVGLDNAKVGVLDDNGAELNRALEIQKKDKKHDEKLDALAAWWDKSRTSADDDKKVVNAAALYGGKQALVLTSYVPLVMAVLYLLLILYFRATGGYKAVHIDSPESMGTAES
jgi:MFS family permease